MMCVYLHRVKGGGDTIVNSKERMFNEIDDLIDRGVDVFRLRSELSTIEYERLRKRAARSFGSYAKALAEYGLCEDSRMPTDVELARCFEINAEYEVISLPNADNLCWEYSLDDATFRCFAKPIVEALEIDALDNFYRDQFPFDKYPTTDLREGLPTLYSYLRKHYGTYKQFLRAYGINYRYIGRDYGGRAALLHGHVFEQKLGVILEAIYSNVHRHVRVGHCIPDFIVNGPEWIDAKLSAESIFDPRCKTIEKYVEETDALTIYYARRKTKPFSCGIARVLHVSTLYPKLLAAGRADLIADMNEFIASISYGKEAQAA